MRQGDNRDLENPYVAQYWKKRDKPKDFDIVFLAL